MVQLHLGARKSFFLTWPQFEYFPASSMPRKNSLIQIICIFTERRDFGAIDHKGRVGAVNATELDAARAVTGHMQLHLGELGIAFGGQVGSAQRAGKRDLITGLERILH